MYADTQSIPLTIEDFTELARRTLRQEMLGDPEALGVADHLLVCHNADCSKHDAHMH